MIIGLYTLELHLPSAQSLKNKRQVVQRVKNRLRARHNVAVIELEEHADLWQRAGLAVVSIAGRRDALERLFDTVRELAESSAPGHVSETGREFLDAVDGGPRGWNEEWS